MKTVKFYYSKPVHVRLLPCVTDAQGEPLFLHEKMQSKIMRTLPRITVAAMYDSDTNSMAFGVAVCSPKDVFKKAIGRELAKNRAEVKPIVEVKAIRRGCVRSVSRRYANEIISSYLSKNVQFNF